MPCDCGDACGHAYYCHSACDECIDDSDCDGGATCNYDILSQHWACAQALKSFEAKGLVRIAYGRVVIVDLKSLRESLDERAT